MKWYLWAIAYNLYGILRICTALEICNVSFISKIYFGVILILIFIFMGVKDRWCWMKKEALREHKLFSCLLFSAILLSCCSLVL